MNHEERIIIMIINDNNNNNYDNNNIKFKTTIIRSGICHYNDVYILVKRTIIVLNIVAQGAAVNNTNKKVIFKNCAPFTSCITKIINTQVDYAKNIDIVMSMCNLIEYINAYSKTLGNFWQYHRDKPALDSNNNITDFPDDNNNSTLVKFKEQVTEQTENGGKRDVEIKVSLKDLSNFWRTFEMPLIKCEISLQLTCSKKKDSSSRYCSKSSTKI